MRKVGRIKVAKSGVEFVPEVSGLPPTVQLCTLRLELTRFVSSVLELLCGFDAAYALWYWLMKRTHRLG